MRQREDGKLLGRGKLPVPPAHHSSSKDTSFRFVVLVVSALVVSAMCCGMLGWLDELRGALG